MIKILGFILTIVGGIGLVMGVLGVFGSMNVGMSPWALIILGIVFFPSWNWTSKKSKRHRSGID